MPLIPDFVSSFSGFRFAQWFERNFIAFVHERRQLYSVTLEIAEKLLQKLKPNVSDIDSVSAAHYLIPFLVNKLLDNIGLSSVDELNNGFQLCLSWWI